MDRATAPKNNHFAVFATATGELIDVTRRRGDSVVSPAPGTPVLIDPRGEDPLIFMELDLIDTYYFLPKEAMDPKEYQRAEYTISVLRLNDRDLLPAAREEAYRSYRARLSEYITKRNNGVSKKELKDLVHALQRMGHPTVWEERKRQHRQVPELKPLFEQAPEALGW